MGLLSPWEEHPDTLTVPACDSCRAHVRIIDKHCIVIAYPEILQVSDVEVPVEVKGKAILFQLEA